MKQEPEGFPEFWAAGERLPAVEFLREVFSYDAENGQLFWKSRPPTHFKRGRCRTVESAAKKWNDAHAGKQAGSDHGNGYRKLSIFKTSFYVHRIIWKIETGEEPEVIDHLNGKRGDNRFSNLRSCSQADNCRNQSRGKGAGVYSAGRFGWYGQVPVGGRTISKIFKTKEEAMRWRERRALEVGFTNRHLGVENAQG